MRKRIITATVLVGLILAAQPLLALDLSADFTQTDKSGEVTTGKIYYAADKVRVETESKEGMVVGIVRLDKKVMWNLMPDNMYVEVPLPDNFERLDGEPYGEYTVKDLGTEEVNGYMCTVKQYTYKKRALGIMVQWYSPELEMVIKTENRKANGKVEQTTVYTNIKKGKQPAKLFELPEGASPFGIGGALKLF